MKATWTTLLALCAPAALAGPPAPATTRYLPSRHVILQYRTNSTSGLATDLYVSTDAGRNWQLTQADHPAPGEVRFTAPTDGKYDIYLQLRNSAGTSGEPPRPGTKPQISVVVDTLPPLLQIHRARVEPSADQRPLVILETSLVEENLSETGVRVFYRGDREQWLDGGTADSSTGEIRWTPPDRGAFSIDLRVVATDLAGNRATSEVRGVALPGRSERRHEPDAAPSAPTTQPGDNRFQPAEPVSILPVSPAVLDRGSAGSTPMGGADAPSPRDTAEIEHLRTLAARFAAEGRYSLAAARLDDALRLWPANADLLVEAGHALYKLGQHEDARRRFSAALAVRPDHAAALDGLALVAATERRFPEARQHLQHLLRLLPESGSAWLRYGDIEHRLGSTAQALDAWERVLKIPGTDTDTRQKAQRRLEYFRPSSTRN